MTISQPKPFFSVTLFSYIRNKRYIYSGSVFVDLVLIVTPIVEFCNSSMFCCALLCVHSSFAIISMGKRELDALLCLSFWCLVIVVWLFLTMSRICLSL